MSSQLAIATMLKEPAARHESLRRTTPADRTAETAQGGDYCVAAVPLAPPPQSAHRSPDGAAGQGEAFAILEYMNIS